jgi:large subunit ribosomal protein L5
VTKKVYPIGFASVVKRKSIEAGESVVMSSELKERYTQEVAPALMKSLNFTNVMQVPKIKKVVVNIGVGEALDNAKALDAAVEDLTKITGQKPVIANFKLREGRAIGVKVDLRGERMWSFLDRLMNIALPRVRDFRGISPDSFDGRGNYTLGLREQLVFTEIQYDKIDKVRGLEISIVTNARSDEEGRELLRMLGMPFWQEG